jgi:outer membrane protein
MKKIIQIAAAATLFLGLATTLSAQKVGYVNSLQILSEMPEYKQAEANITALRQQIEKKGNQMVQDLQSDAMEVEQKAQAGQLSPLQEQEEMKRLQEEQAKIQKYQQDSQKQLADRQSELMEPLSKKLNDAIAAVAQEGGYTMVIDIQALVYYEPSEDLTAKVKSKLGM